MATRIPLEREDCESSIIQLMRRQTDGRRSIDLRERVLVSELRAGQRPTWVELLILRSYPARTVYIDRKEHTVVAACARDESGVIGIVLWNEDAIRVGQGDVLRMHDGWVRAHSGRKVLSAGRHGWVELISPSTR